MLPDLYLHFFLYQATFEVLFLFFNCENSFILNKSKLNIKYDPKDDPKWVKTEDKTTCDQGIILINKCYEDVL